MGECDEIPERNGMIRRRQSGGSGAYDKRYLSNKLQKCAEFWNTLCQEQSRHATSDVLHSGQHGKQVDRIGSRMIAPTQSHIDQTICRKVRPHYHAWLENNLLFVSRPHVVNKR
jgi:hypothetical protein